MRARELVVQSELMDYSSPTIYLVWTTPVSTFSLRNHRVLDCYYFHHPDAHVIIYATDLTSQTFSEYTRSGYRLTVVNATDEALLELSAGCPGEEWMRNMDRWRRDSPYFYSHLTDFIRFCALYRWGGVYSDFDALQLNSLALVGGKTFIGRDSSGAKGSCKWCLAGGDIYLAPGVMGSVPGHPLVRRSLEIAFESGDYDPAIFNGVGPMAVTKAYHALDYRETQSVVAASEEVFYPYTYLNSAETLRRSAAGDAEAHVDSLQRKSVSLHLYGHMTKRIPIEEGSIVDEVIKRFSVVVDPLRQGPHMVEQHLKAPKYIGVSKVIQAVPNVRVVGDFTAEISILIECRYGSIKLFGNETDSRESNWNSMIIVRGSTPAQVNVALAKLAYKLGESPDGLDSITAKVYEGRQIHIPAKVTEIPVYDLNKLVTVMIKTMDRITKGYKRGFYYLPLQYDIGLSAGRNRMVDKISTKYVLTLDDDFIFTKDSSIEALIHALETKDKDGLHYDIAAGKNPADEERFDIDFCGIFTITESRVLSLGPGDRGSPHAGCHHVDFVPNIFVARTDLLRDRLRWDELLKLGEHEDFFIRARELGVRTLTCPGVSFHHNQVAHWKGDTEYDKKRARVYDFLRLSLRKHGLTKLVSFGRTMMDLTLPDLVHQLYVTEVMARTVTLYWRSSAFAFKVLQSSDNGNSWGPVNYGEGEQFEPAPQIPTTDPEGPSRPTDAYNKIVVFGLQPQTTYIFRVFAGNRFDFEEHGQDYTVKTLSLSDEYAQNLLENPSFEYGKRGYQISENNTFAIIEDPKTQEHMARSQITTVGYMYNAESTAAITQAVPGIKPNRALSKLPSHIPRTLTVSVRSRLDRIFDSHPSWRLELRVWFGPRAGGGARVCHPLEGPLLHTDDGSPVLHEKLAPTTTGGRRERESAGGAFEDESAPSYSREFRHDPRLERPSDVTHRVEFDRSVEEVWQSRVLSLCLAPDALIAFMEVSGVLETFRGSVTWDDFVLTVGRGQEAP
ncbi:hypothetical protein DFJ73DRAFT_28732 [Zopfochytrium polystomum]|nr:hypothetical protein DFJ73DRAFT_28732 [Zopfochytrium polystomum]